MARVEVAGHVLGWALERSNRTVDELRAKFPKIREWLAGESQPTLRQLESFAKTTVTPLGYFFLEEPPVDRLPIPHFRTLRDERLRRPSPDLIETIHAMQRRQAWMREFLQEEEGTPLSFVKSATKSQRRELIAQRIRKLLDIDETWAESQRSWTDALRVLRERMESAGILVVVNGIVGNNTHRKLDKDEFRGFVLVDEYAPLVFVNGSDYKAAQMFTLGHELAHVFLGSSAAFDLRTLQPADDPNEQVCNQIAAEFLVPAKMLRTHWESISGKPEPFQLIARKFKVSVLVAARRALDLGLVDQDGFLRFYKQYQKNWGSATIAKDGGDFYSTQNLRVGQRFAATVVRAAREGRILYSEAYDLTGLYGRTFEEYASKLEGGERLVGQ